MQNIIKSLVVFYCFMALSPAVHSVSAQETNDWEEPDAVLVGRISHVEGDLSRYDPTSDRWVSTTREAPFGIDDLLRTDTDARAEIILPNNTWARIDSDTRIQLTVLTPKTTEVDLPLGNARFYNKSKEAEISATTPFGRITAPPGAAFDLFVADDGIDIIAVQNSVYFYHNASSQRHEVRSDASGLSADSQEITAIAGDGDPDWADWNRRMDDLWAERMDTRGESATYLPPELYTEAYALDRHGYWERVYYEGHYYRFWRPVHISIGWSPFSWGAWIVWHGDHVWIPHEPFGYVTHHYGNWIFTAGHWYWAPPVTYIAVRARLPLLHIGFAWYPGRVSWIHSGAYVGWIPLAPYEPYYTYRHWGRRSIAHNQWKGPHHRQYAHRHRRHAVVIHSRHLYRSDDYRRLRVRDIAHRKIGDRFRSARLLDRKVLKDHRSQEKHDRFYQAHRRRPAWSGQDTRNADGHRRYGRYSDDKRPSKRKALNPTGGRRPEENHGRASSKRITSSKRIKPVPYDGRVNHDERVNRSGPKTTGAAQHHRQGRQTMQHRPKELRDAATTRERHRFKKEKRSYGRQPPANQWKVNRSHRNNTNDRQHGKSVSRQRERPQAATSPPAVHRRSRQDTSAPIVGERRDNTSSKYRPRQEQNRQQWQRPPSRGGGERNEFRRFRGGGGRHRHWN